MADKNAEVAVEDNGGMKKTLSLWNFFTIGFGAIIGTGWVLQVGDWMVVGGGPAGIMAAEAEAQAIMQVQTALADSLKLLNAAAPNDQVVKLKALETMEKVADGKATKIIIPSEIQGIAGLAEGVVQSIKDVPADKAE